MSTNKEEFLAKVNRAHAGLFPAASGHKSD
jgi:hypothetical protein